MVERAPAKVINLQLMHGAHDKVQLALGLRNNPGVSFHRANTAVAFIELRDLRQFDLCSKSQVSAYVQTTCRLVFVANRRRYSHRVWKLQNGQDDIPKIKAAQWQLPRYVRNFASAILALGFGDELELER